jgi:hypothetical protein
MTNTIHTHPHNATAHPPFSPRRHSPGTMLHCPGCHLNLRQRHPQIAIDYCPRCIARAHELVPLLPAPTPMPTPTSTPTPTLEPPVTGASLRARRLASARPRSSGRDPVAAR